MKELLFYAFLGLLLATCGDAAQQETAPQTVEEPALNLRVEAVMDSLTAQIFGDSAVFEVLADGMAWAEGPLVLPDESVIWSDVPNNHILRWSADAGARVWLENSGNAPDDYSSEPGSNGLILDASENLILCQHGARSVARMMSDWNRPLAKYEVLADNYQGRRFNSPNDLVRAPDGSILFTDPIYGLPGGEDSALRELDFCGVFRITPTGEVQLLTRDYRRPNGIGLSPDGQTLYLANSDGDLPVVTATPLLDADYALGAVDTLINAKNLVGEEVGYPDGLAVGKNGRIFATAPGGVWVLDPDGTLLSKVKTGLPVANVTLSAREDWLYLTSDNYLIRVKLPTHEPTE